jgi:hypothetical protein
MITNYDVDWGPVTATGYDNELDDDYGNDDKRGYTNQGE